MDKQVSLNLTPFRFAQLPLSVDGEGIEGLSGTSFEQFPASTIFINNLNAVGSPHLKLL